MWALCDLAATSLSVGQSVPTSQGCGVGLPGKAPWKTQAELADGQGLSSAVTDLVLLGSPASPSPSAQTAGYAGMSQGEERRTQTQWSPEDATALPTCPCSASESQAQRPLGEGI